MKYLLLSLLLLISGSVFGQNEVLPYCPDGKMGCLVFHYGTQEEVDSMMMAIKPHEYYLDTVEVCDTVWYNKLYLNSEKTGHKRLGENEEIFSEVECRDAVISKQKKQVWLTEEEYNKLMELLGPGLLDTWYVPVGDSGF